MSKSITSSHHINGLQADREKSSDSVRQSQVSDSEVVPKAKRRVFSKSEKLRILKLADACTQSGEVGALLRREGIYSSYLATWREQRDKGQLEPQKRGRPENDPKDKELARLRAENAKLSKKLEQAETIIEVQKKLSALLGLNNDQTEKGDRK